jgi:hypothetical protein
LTGGGTGTIETTEAPKTPVGDEGKVCEVAPGVRLWVHAGIMCKEAELAPTECYKHNSAGERTGIITDAAVCNEMVDCTLNGQTVKVRKIDGCDASGQPAKVDLRDELSVSCYDRRTGHTYMARASVGCSERVAISDISKDVPDGCIEKTPAG